MKKMRFLAALAVAIAMTAGSGLWADPNFHQILKQIDDMQDFTGLDYSAVITFVTEKPGEKTSTTQARLFRRDTHDQFVLLIMLPAVQKGQGYLKIDDNVWFYDPESRKFSHSTMKENISGSKAKNSDLSRKTIEEDYEIAATSEGTIGKFPVWIIELKAKNNEVSYPKVKLYVRKDPVLTLKQEDFSVSDRLMRTTLLPKYMKVGDKMIPSMILINDELNKGEKTQVTITEPSIATLPDKVFTKTFLEQVSQ